MKTRFLCLLLIAPFLLLSASACSSDSKPAAKGPAVPDPEGNAKPKPAGARPG
jgi:hypothetical protein